MRPARAPLVTLILGLVAASITAAIASSSDLPNRVLTPGVVRSRDIAAVCSVGRARALRPRGRLWNQLKDETYNRYGLPHGQRSTVDAQGHHHAAYQIDHLIPLELGGAPTDIRNLWPQPAQSAKQKDRVENALHERVCSGAMTLQQAQAAIANDWKHAFVGEVVR